MYLLAMLPLLAFGIYKNGVEVFIKGYANFWQACKPLILIFASVSGAFVGGLIREWYKTKKIDISLFDKIKGDIIEALLVVAILPIDSNAIMVFVAMLLGGLLFGKIKLNKMALLYIIIESTNVVLGLNNFKNAYEVHTVLNLNGVDLFFGAGVGGIFATNAFLVLLASLFLSYNKLYKKEMVFTSLGVFVLLGALPKMIGGNYADIFPYIFGYNVLFILVFIAPNLYSSSYTLKGQVVSGVIIGALTVMFSKFTPYTAALLAVVITSALKGVLDRIFVIK